MRRKVDRRLSLSLWEQRRRPPPAAETGRSCWGRGQRDASGSEADAGSRNPGSATEGGGEGKPAYQELSTQRCALAFVRAMPSLFFCFSVASLPSQSRFARQLPQRGSLWRVGQAHAGRAKFLYIENSSALLQRAAASEQYPCQAAANLCSRALFFALY